MSDFHLWWLSVSLLYMGTGIVLHFRYADRGLLPRSVPLTFLAFGAAIFSVLNRAAVADTVSPESVEAGAILMLLAAWGFAVWAVRSYLSFALEYLPDGGPEHGPHDHRHR